MATQRFPFAFDPRHAAVLRLLFGATPDTSEVVVDDERFVARFGRLRCRTPIDNIAEVRITRDYRAIRAIGARGSLADRGATFGTNTEGGVCVCFREPVGALFGPKVRVHPALTVTVADLEGLADAVRARISPADAG